MLRFFGRYIVAPIGIYILFIFIFVILANKVPGLIVAHSLGFPVITLVWWVSNISRWFYQKYNWETVPYLLSNLFWGLGLSALGLAFGAGLANTAGVFVFLGMFLTGAGWIVHSIYKLFAERQSIYNSVHWLPLGTDWTSFPAARKEKAKNSFDSYVPISQMMENSSERKAKNSGGSYTPISQMMENNPKKKAKEESKSVFRSIGPAKTNPDESLALPIPPRRDAQTAAKTPPRPAVPATPNVQIGFSSPRGNFVTEAKRNVKRTEASAVHVPFMQYWPTYGSMSQAQTKWYFYWRNQVRSGNYLPTDTSYMFVYIYELINMVGFDKPQEALEQLVRFYRAYRERQPKLDNYLPDWIADFIVVHRLPVGVMAWYRKLGEMGVSGDEDLSIEAWLQAGGAWETLPLQSLYRVADYNPTKAKFYKQEGSKMNLDAAYLQGIKAVDAYLRNEKQKSLLEFYQSARTRTISRPIFSSAVHDYPAKQIDIASVHSWIGNEALGNALKNILRFTENVVRENNGYKHKLRDIELAPEWEKAIKAAFVVAKPKQEIKIDETALEQLKQESESIRKRLILSEETPANENNEKLDIAVNRLSLESEAPLLEEPERLQATLKEQSQELKKAETPKAVQEIDLDMQRLEAMKVESEKLRERLIFETPEEESSRDAAKVELSAASYTLRPLNTDEHLLTDLAPVASILGKADSEVASIARFLMENNWSSTLGEIQAKLGDKFANVIIDSINEKAYDLFSDALLFEDGAAWTLNEEYQDEVEYILKHPEYQAALTANYADLSPEWADFASRLQQAHWEALAALLSQDDIENRLNAIAKAVHKTGNLLVDEINEAAQESLGDILIDTSEGLTILEEEQPLVTDLLNWALSRQMIEG